MELMRFATYRMVQQYLCRPASRIAYSMSVQHRLSTCVDCELYASKLVSELYLLLPAMCAESVTMVCCVQLAKSVTDENASCVQCFSSLRKFGVGKLIMSSSPSTRFDGNDIDGLAEDDLSMPKTFLQVLLCV